jgi:hypothetical protein
MHTFQLIPIITIPIPIPTITIPIPIPITIIVYIGPMHTIDGRKLRKSFLGLIFHTPIFTAAVTFKKSLRYFGFGGDIKICNILFLWHNVEL